MQDMDPEPKFYNRRKKLAKLGITAILGATLLGYMIKQPARDAQSNDPTPYKPKVQAEYVVDGATTKKPEPDRAVVAKRNAPSNGISIESSRPSRTLDDLVVNTANKYRVIVYDDEITGIKKMQELVDDSKFEEAWIYLPEQKVWVEVGTNEKVYSRNKEGAIASVGVEGNILYQLINDDNKSITLYHIHPYNKATAAKNEKEFRKDAGDKIEEKQLQSILDSLAIVEESSASKDDITSCVRASLTFNSTYPDSTLSDRICSKYGITEMTLTEEGKRLFGNMLIDDVKDYIGKHKDKALDKFTSYLVSDDLKSAKDGVAKFFELLSDDYVKITFTSYEDYFKSNK